MSLRITALLYLIAVYTKRSTTTTSDSRLYKHTVPGRDTFDVLANSHVSNLLAQLFYFLEIDSSFR